jgi:hypothetical protein
LDLRLLVRDGATPVKQMLDELTEEIELGLERVSAALGGWSAS